MKAMKRYAICAVALVPVGGVLLLTVTLGLNQRMLSTDVAATLAADRKTGEPVYACGGYPYDLPFIARLQQPVIVVQDWPSLRTSASDNFGRSVAISGNYAVIGAYGEDDAGGTDSGKAYIFDATTGSLLHTLNNPNAYSTSADDYFGTSVAISGNRVVVGAVCEDDASSTDSGKVYLYNLN